VENEGEIRGRSGRGRGGDKGENEGEIGGRKRGRERRGRG